MDLTEYDSTGTVPTRQTDESFGNVNLSNWTNCPTVMSAASVESIKTAKIAATNRTLLIVYVCLFVSVISLTNRRVCSVGVCKCRADVRQLDCRTSRRRIDNTQ